MFIPNVSVGIEKSTAPLSKSALLLSLSAVLLTPVHVAYSKQFERKPQQRWVLQAIPRTSTSSSFAPTETREFVPRTRMAKRLWELRQQIIREDGTSPANSLLATIQEIRKGL